LSSFSLTRTVTVNGVQHSFQQPGTIRVGWCRDVFTLDSTSVAVDTGQGILTVNVAGAAPVVSEGPTTVSLTSPLAGATFSAPANIPLSATAAVTIGVVNKVEFYRDGTLVATVLNPPYTATDTSVPAGAHTYTAVAYNDEDPNDILLGSVAAAVTVSGAVAQQQMYFIQTDHLNTPRMIANQAGTTVWKWDNTEPFGNSMPSDDPDGDSVAFVFDLRFPGQYFDRETNLAYNWRRDYDASIGRYIESDPIGLDGGINTYAYVTDDPLRHIDPLGLAKFCCRPVSNPFFGGVLKFRHCFVEADDGTTYSLFGGWQGGGYLGLPSRQPDGRDTKINPLKKCSDCPPDCGVDQNKCLSEAAQDYPIGGYSPVGTNSNTFAGTLARKCCKGGVPADISGAPGIGLNPPDPFPQW